MHGTFNGLPIRNISSMKIETDPSGIKRTSFRILDASLPKLEQILHLRAPALLILSSSEVEGRIVHYTADVHIGYEITIESNK